MPKRRFSRYALWLAIPLLTALTQASMKLLAGRMADTPFGWEWLQAAMWTPWAAIILICEVFGFLLWLMILSDTSISKATPITATAYLLILGMSWTFFHESVHPLQVIGSALILGGVYFIGTAQTEQSSS